MHGGHPPSQATALFWEHPEQVFFFFFHDYLPDVYSNRQVQTRQSNQEWSRKESLSVGFTKRAHRFFRPSGAIAPPRSPDLPFRAYERVKSWGHRASRPVELRANQAIPRAEQVIITASRT